MISFKDVSFEYTEGQECLKKINIEIGEGEVLLICGPSGCGKSTFVRCINGLIPHFYKGNLTGNIDVNGIDVPGATLRKVSKLVGTVFQNPRSQFFNVDTTSEIAFGCENLCVPPDEIEQRINKVVNRHDLGSLMDRNIFKLSGGEKQKIACASIAAEPVEVVVLDEPSANLDYRGICELQRMIEGFIEEHRTIIISEHRISYLLPYITRAVLMERGEIVREFPADEMRGMTEEEMHELGLRADGMQDPGKIVIQEKTGPDNREKYILQNMKFSYRGGNIVFDIPLMEIPKGEIIAITGENGAGKSTFLRCLCGVVPSCKAKLKSGNEVWNNRARRRNIYLVMQDVNHQLFTGSVLEEVMISQKKEDKEKALEILEKLDLVGYEDKHPLALSGGQKQRVAVASAIASERDIILFDEPTSGLDYTHMLQVAEILKKLAEAGKTVMIVTHDSELIKNACTSLIHFDTPGRG